MAAPERPREDATDWKLELVVIPVADQDRAKAFNVDTLGWHLVVDHRAGEEFRVVQLSPPGSPCAVALMRRPDAAGSVQALHLAVSDIEQARAALVRAGVTPSELFHVEDGAQREGPDPQRGDDATFCTFSDPDGTGWTVQEVGGRAPSTG